MRYIHIAIFILMLTKKAGMLATNNSRFEKLIFFIFYLEMEDRRKIYAPCLEIEETLF